MRKVWKWVIGIVVVLVVVAALVGGAFLLRSHFMNAGIAARSVRPVPQLPGNQQAGPFGDNQRGQPGWPGGMMPYGNDGWNRRGMRGFGMQGFGRMMPFGALFACLFGLGLLALLVLGIIWLVNRNKRPMVPVAVAPVEPAASAVPLVATHTCSKCGEQVQDNWKHCPNCGKRQ
jgi:hypothetical protein